MLRSKKKKKKKKKKSKNFESKKKETKLVVEVKLLQIKYNNLRILTGKSTLKLNSSVYEKYKYGHLGYWYMKLTLFKRF